MGLCLKRLVENVIYLQHRFLNSSNYVVYQGPKWETWHVNRNATLFTKFKFYFSVRKIILSTIITLRAAIILDNIVIRYIARPR